MNALQKRMFEEARKRNPDLKMPASKPQPEWTEADLALIKQGVGDKGGRPDRASGGGSGEGGGEAPPASKPALW